MAAQTITSSANHDDLTGRLAGETITIQNGAVLLIDSYPQDTDMGVLGDINITSGEIHVDGRYVREVSYNTGSGSLPQVGTAISYGTSGVGKVINLTSGNATSGVITITIQGPLEEPSGSITDGSWSATVVTSKIGILKVFGVDQVWDAVDSTCTLRINGDWYEVAVGDGTDNQSITLPHTGRQTAVWVETGNNTNIFQIWMRVNTEPSSVYFDSVSDWGDSFETGFVFECIAGSDVINFGTSTNGGAPPNGARIRIPNVHMGTTTLANPQTEIISNVLGQHVSIVDSLVTENVFIDHLNGSTVDVTLNQTNGATITDSVIHITGGSLILNNPAPVNITNCAFIFGIGTVLGGLGARFAVLDNLGGITITDCVMSSGYNASNTAVLVLSTMANVILEGTNKIVSMEQDENSAFCIRATTAARVFNNGTLLLLNGGITTLSGCVNIDLGDIAWGQLLSRGPTEDSLVLISATATDTFKINSGRFLDGGGIGPFKGALMTFTDSANILVQNFGSVDNKLNNGGFGASIFNLAGITNNAVFRRCYFTNCGTNQMITTLNSVSGVTFENCGTDYNDELEMDSSNMVIKGVHCGSGSPQQGTGVEGDLINVVGSVFYDHFKSDTTGAVGLVFSSPGIIYSSYFQVISGNPVFNGIGDILMPNVGDQVVYSWPYDILGHTGFEDLPIELAGVNTGNMSYEYDIDTGSGYSGSYQIINGANLSAESISPAGFRLRIRITTVTANNNRLDGLAIRTTTTIADQLANLYPLEQTLITATMLSNSRVQVYNVTTDSEIDNTFITGTVYSSFFTTEVSSGDVIRMRVTKKGYRESQSVSVVSGQTVSLIISQEIDTVYESYGIDGDTVNKFTPDYLNNQVDLIVSSNFGGAEFYAWNNANLTTEEGIRNFYGAVSAIDEGNIRINASSINLLFDNTTSSNVFQNDNIRIFRSDNAYPVANPTSGGGGIDLVWRNQVYVVSVGGSSLTPTESSWLSDINTISSRINGLIEDSGGDRFTAKALEEAPSGGPGGPGGGDTKEDIYDYFTTSNRQNTFRADVSAIPTNPLLESDLRIDNLALSADVRADMETLNEGIKKASLLIPHSENLP